jgi:uric acid transporter
LSAVDFRNNRNNLFIVAIAVAFGLLTLISPAFFKNFPVARSRSWIQASS